MNDIDRYAATNIMAQSRIEELERRLAEAEKARAQSTIDRYNAEKSAEHWKRRFESLETRLSECYARTEELQEAMYRADCTFPGQDRRCTGDARCLLHERNMLETGLRRSRSAVVWLTEQRELIVEMHANELCALAFDYGRLEAERDALAERGLEAFGRGYEHGLEDAWK